MKKYFIANVNFGTNNSEENKNCFLDINDVTTSSLNVQIAVFGRQFPLRATKDQMMRRIDEQIAAMNVWHQNLIALKKQVILEDLRSNFDVYREFLPEKELKKIAAEVK